MKITGTPQEVVSKLTEGKYKITSARSNLNNLTVEFENIPSIVKESITDSNVEEPIVKEPIVEKSPVKFARRSKKKSKDEEQE